MAIWIFALIVVVKSVNLYCGNASCQTCLTGLAFLNISCLDLCPNGYDEVNSLYCNPNQNTILTNLDFSQHLSYTTYIVGDFKQPESLPLNDPSRKGPIPILFQGFYFDDSSRLISTQSWVLSPIFTLHITIMPTQDGTIFEVLNVSNVVIKLYINSGQLKLSILLSSGLTKSLNTLSSTITYNQWNIFQVYVKQMLGSIYIKLKSTTTTLSGLEFREQIAGMDFYIGSNSGSFRGFFYKLLIDNSESAFILKGEGNTQCGYNQYYNLNNGHCEDCTASCNTWPWCVRGENCYPCLLQECTSCSGIGYNDCNSCSNSRPAPDCEVGTNCNTGYGFLCTSCKAGYSLIDGHCVKFPYLYDNTQLSTPVINEKFTVFQSYYGSIFQSGDDPSSYRPYNNPLSEDPVPLKGRGLFFDGTSFLKSSTAITMNYKFTLVFWIKPFDYNLRMLWNSEYIEIKSAGYMIIGLTNPQIFKYDYTSLTYYSLQWQFLGFIVDFIDITTVVSLLYNNQGTQIVLSVEGYMLYDEPNTVLVGKGGSNNNFYGYLYSLTLWQTTIYNLLAYYNDCPYPNVGSCDLNIGLVQYYNYYKQGLYSCDSSCSYCSTWGTCNQCLFPGCVSCSSYDSTCTDNNPTPCLSGLHYTQTKLCCSSDCSDCFGPDNFSCRGCENNKNLLGSICVDSCPTSMSSISHICQPSISGVVSITLNEIKNDVVDSFNGIVFRSGSSLEFYHEPDLNDPWPAFGRGYYFRPNSFMTSGNFMVSYNCTIAVIVKRLDFGVLFTKNSLSITFTNTKTILTLDSNQVYDCSFVPGSQWYLLVFSFYSNIDSVLTVGFGYSTASHQTYNSLQSFIYYDTYSNSVIGDNGNSFTGFVWSLLIKNEYLVYSDYSVAICASSADTNCLVTCDIDYFLSGSQCLQCDNSCTRGCRRQIDCNLCLESRCIDCNSYINPCTYCDENSYQLGRSCYCFPGYLKSLNGACNACPRKALDSICIDMCPIGYYASGVNCTMLYNDGVAFRLHFNEISGIYYDSISNLPVLTGKTEQYYPNLEDSDPIPAYLRGVYFTGTGSYLLFPFPNSSIVLLGLRSFFSLWVNPRNSTGVLLTNFNQSNAELLTISLINYKLKLKVLIAGHSYSLESANQLTYESWNHIIVSLAYSSLSTGLLTINTIPNQISTFASEPFIHNSSSQAYLGKSITNDYFTGFIYLIEIYVKSPELSSLVSVKCADCSVGLPTNMCIPNCNITTFYSIVNFECESCLEKCDKGCRNNDSCLLCSDLHCFECDQFSDKSCTKCFAPYELVNATCVVCNKTSFYESDSQKCRACEGLCETCIGLTHCLSCIKNSSLVSEGICDCDLGYYLSDNLCNRSLFSAFLTISQDNTCSIVFSEVLKVNLTIESLSVSINNDPVSFTLKQIDIYSYALQMKITESKGTLWVYFTSEITSVNNSLLGINFLRAKLFESTLSTVISSVKFVKDNLKSISRVSQGAIFGSSLMNFDPNSMFTFFNSAELFCLTIIYDIDLSQDIIEFLKSIQLNSIIPFSPPLNQVTLLSMNASLPQNLQDFGYKTSMILINSEWFILILLTLVVINSLLLCLRFVIWKRFQGICTQGLSWFQYKIYLRYWIQTFMELVINAIAGIYFCDFSHHLYVLNFAICLVVIIIQCSCVFLLVKIIKNRKKLSDSYEIESYSIKFGTIFDEFKQDNPNQWLYYFLFVVRRIIIALSLFFLQVGLLQLMISGILSIAVILYELTTNCYLNKIDQIYTVLSEVVLLLYYILQVVDQSPGIISENNRILFTMVLVGLLVFFTILTNFAKLAQNLREKCRKKNKIAINIEEAEDTIKFNYLKKKTEKVFNMVNPSPVMSCIDERSYFEENPLNNSIADQNILSPKLSLSDYDR